MNINQMGLRLSQIIEKAGVQRWESASEATYYYQILQYHGLKGM